MKKLILLGVVLVLVLAVSLPRVTQGYSFTTHTLWAGQNIPVGTVKVSNDCTNLLITYIMSGDWSLQDTHVAVEEVFSNIPENNGNPTPGQFRYHDSPWENPLGTYTIPLVDSTDPNPHDWAGDDTLYIATHGVVYGSGGHETAWAGDKEFSGANWALYFEYTVQVCP